MNIRHGISLLTFWFYLPLWGADQPSEKIVELTTKAEKGDASAQNELGEKYYYGSSVEKDIMEAVKWYRKAAEQGYAKAQFNMGWMYDHGQGVLEDDKEAVKWYRKAAEQGNARAQYGLGWMYRQGKDVEQDDDEAVKWYQKAAGQRNAGAQYSLGVMYWMGEGVEKSIAQACLWWSLAAEQDHEKAKKWKPKAAAELTPEDAVRVDRWIKEWSAWKLARGWPENPQETQGPFATLEKKFGIRVHYKEVDIFTGDSNRGDNLAKPIKPNELKRLPKILERALAKYPPKVVQKYLNRVRFVEDLFHEDSDMAGLSTPERKSLYVEVSNENKPRLAKKVEATFHHELAHILYDISTFPTEEWIGCNPKGFEYKKGLEDKQDWELWKDGFYSNFSRTDMEEDFCEFSELVFEPRKAKLLLEHYPTLDRKFSVWLKVYQKIDEISFTRERLLSKNALDQKQNQPPITERDKLLELKKGTYVHLPTLKPYSGKIVKFRDREQAQKKYETLYREGKEVSESWFWYHKEGWLSQEALYRNDKKISATYFYPNGKKEQKIPYKDGKKEGTATYWDEEDRVEQKAVFRNDRKISTTYFYWYPNGKRKIERPFKNGKEEGLSTYWYPNGQKEKEIAYKGGNMDGKASWWYDNGNKQIEAMYRNGSEIRNKTKFWKPDGTPKQRQF